MIIEILVTGDEIRTGAVIDRNSAYIAQALEEMGLEVIRHSCVGDDMTHLVAILKEIGNRSDIAVVTGGLGPTPDDLTAEAAARAAGVDRILNRSAYRAVENYFKVRHRPMDNANKKQALLPRGSDPMMNPVGTAPGFILKIDRCMFFFLPGVPFEMQRMLSESVLPRIEKLKGSTSGFSMVKTLSTFGFTEAAIAERLAHFTTKFPEIKLGFRTTFPEIQIKLYGRRRKREDLHKLMDRAILMVLREIGDNVLSTNGYPMEVVVGRLLAENNATLAVAESCTGGLISHMLTNVAGSSKYFLLSNVTYSNKAKIRVLGVPPEVLERFGAVHEKTAKEMAQGVMRLAGATYGLATSGIAGPDGGTNDKPVGTVCIGLATRGSVQGFRFQFSFNTRQRNKKIFAVQALDLLRRRLITQVSHP